jgi:hypothetical protein
LLAITIIVSRKLVSMGRKFCLFVYYVKLIGIELWMTEEVTTLNGGLENKILENMIRRRIWKLWRQVFLFSSLVSGDGRFDLL